MARKTREEAQRTRQQIIDAARTTFNQHGVARSSLAQIASAAGLTRGAVYWHFKNKAELFLSMREDVFVPMIERMDTTLFSNSYSDPLDAIEAALKDFFLVLDECPNLRQVLEIMVLRCEQVDEFAEIQAEIERPGQEFLQKMEKVYQKAASHGSLRPGQPASALALDTWAFISGLLHALLTRGFEKKLKQQVPAMIVTHMQLRRG
ncbi:MAG: TetR family transcriptional regulator [Gammaproteobacteria bacterium]|nr:TetR family transcriptional regulator [Gammaproteobacteria bacterium]